VCGIAGIVFKDKKVHPVGKYMTRMLKAVLRLPVRSEGFDLEVSTIEAVFSEKEPREGIE